MRHKQPMASRYAALAIGNMPLLFQSLDNELVCVIKRIG